MLPINGWRIIWWIAFILIALACAGAVAFTVAAHESEERNIQDYVKATRSDSGRSERSGAADAANMDGNILLKEWCVNHGLVSDGIKVIAILFSCLAVFLLTTCLCQRRMSRRPATTRDVTRLTKCLRQRRVSRQ
jgi:hypothetical protein